MVERSWWFLSKLKRIIIWNNLTYMYITEWTEVFKQKLFTNFQSSTLQNRQYLEKNPNTHQLMYKQNNIFIECVTQSLQWIKWINKHGILLRTPTLTRPDNVIFYGAECCGLWRRCLWFDLLHFPQYQAGTWSVSHMELICICLYYTLVVDYRGAWWW